MYVRFAGECLQADARTSITGLGIGEKKSDQYDRQSEQNKLAFH
jgi:hypothetical protein